MKNTALKNPINTETVVLPELEDSYFLEKIQQKVVNILKEEACSFSQLLTQMENCDPIVLEKVLDQLKSRRDITEHSNYFYLITETYNNDKKKTLILESLKNKTKLEQQNLTHNRVSNKTITTLKALLPEATPVYSQWWFHDMCYPILANAIFSRVLKESKIAFIGATTLGAYFSKITDYNTSIFDIDSTLLHVIKKYVGDKTDLIQYDVFNALNPSYENNFDLIYLDPPWYVNTMTYFIKRAAEMSKKGGLIFISFPQLNTRESTKDERENIIKFINTCGLKIMAFWPSGVKYDIPQFEKNAYRKSGINIDAPWRSGDLVLIKKIHSTQHDLPFQTNESHNDIWKEMTVHNCRFFFRKNDHTIDKEKEYISKVSDYNDFFLKTTSRREKGWQEANLITSRNHCATISEVNIVYDILREIHKQNSIDKAWQNLSVKYDDSCNNGKEHDLRNALNILYGFIQG